MIARKDFKPATLPELTPDDFPSPYFDETFHMLVTPVSDRVPEMLASWYRTHFRILHQNYHGALWNMQDTMSGHNPAIQAFQALTGVNIPARIIAVGPSPEQDHESTTFFR